MRVAAALAVGLGGDLDGVDLGRGSPAAEVEHPDWRRHHAELHSLDQVLLQNAGPFKADNCQSVATVLEHVVGEFNWSSQHLGAEELRWEHRSGHGAVWRGGHRCVRLVDRRWRDVRSGNGFEAIGRWLSSEDVGVSCGVSVAVGVRWLRQGGGMSSISLAPPSGRYLCFRGAGRDRDPEGAGQAVRQIAQLLRRDPFDDFAGAAP